MLPRRHSAGTAFTLSQWTVGFGGDSIFTVFFMILRNFRQSGRSRSFTRSCIPVSSQPAQAMSSAALQASERSKQATMRGQASPFFRDDCDQLLGLAIGKSNPLTIVRPAMRDQANGPDQVSSQGLGFFLVIVAHAGSNAPLKSASA
jgi:hypothetical protein